MQPAMQRSLQRHADQFDALGSPIRLAILRQVVQGAPEGTPVGDVQARLRIPWSTLSHHLDKLAGCGLLRSRRSGRFILYRANFATLRALTGYLWDDCCRGGNRSYSPSAPTASETK